MKMKRILSTALASVFLAGALVPGAMGIAAERSTTTDGQTLSLRYDEPASGTNSADTWQEATLPIGNGILGANVYGEIQREHLTLNEETLWSGGRGSVTNYNGGNPSDSKVEVYESYANRLLNGENVTNIEGLAGVSANNSGYYSGYQPLGDLYFQFQDLTGSTSDYVRALDLEQGVATVDFTAQGVSHHRSYFASNPDHVIVSRMTANGGTMSLVVSLTGKQNGSVSAQVNDGKGYITYAGSVQNNGLLHHTQVAVISDGAVSVSGSGIQVSNASEVTVYLTAATDYENTFYDEAEQISYYYRTGETAAELAARVKKVLDSAVNKGYQEVWQDHLKDYQNLYQRLSLNLGQNNTKMTDDLLKAYKNGTATDGEKRYLEVLMFQYGRYLLIAGSRENSQLPTNLQGIWNNSTAAPWYSDIHTNINEEMNYWLSNSCNLTECAVPLVKYMASLEIPGGITVKTYTGSNYGIMAHTQNTPYGYTSPGWSISTWGWSPAAATWLLQNCYDYFEYSQDLDTLRSVIYPMLKEQILMYQDLLKEYNGRLVMPITQSPELSTISAGNTYEQSLIWQLYSDTIEAATILGEDADSIAAWQTTMDQLRPVEIGSSGQVKEWYNETTINSVNNTRSHRHLSNLLGLYPGTLFDSQEKKDAAIVSLNNKNFGRVGTSGNDPEGGWTYGQLIGSWARVGDGENAYFSVSQLLKNRVYNNLWDYHTYNTYGAFQIDGNYGFSAGVAEMLMQSHLGYIELLPAIPQEWDEGSVTGLLAEGNITVDMSWSQGELESATFTAQKGGDCSIRLSEGMVLRNAQGKVVATYADGQDGIVTVSTQAGEAITLSNTALKVQATRNYTGSVVLSWNDQDGLTYDVSSEDSAIVAGISGGSYTLVTAPETEVRYTVTSSEGERASVTVEPVYVKNSTPDGYGRVDASSLTSGTYLVMGARSGYSLNKVMSKDRSLTEISGSISGTTVTPFDGVENYEWIVSEVTDGYTLQSKASGAYLTMADNNVTTASVGTDATVLTISESSVISGSWLIHNETTGAYLNYRADGGGTAGTWTAGDEGSCWYFYRMTTASTTYTIQADVLASAEAKENKENETFVSALERAKGTFETQEEARAAHQALIQAVDGKAPTITLSWTRNADGSITLTWDAKNGVTYTVSRRAVDTAE